MDFEIFILRVLANVSRVLDIHVLKFKNIKKKYLFKKNKKKIQTQKREKKPTTLLLRVRLEVALCFTDAS